jgi:hypothetical protein
MIEYSPVRGDALIFPRYLMHHTTPNTGTENRKVISGVIAYDMVRETREPYLVRARDHSITAS